MKPGVYPGMSMADYLRIPAVSAGLLVTIDQRCPAAAKYESWLTPKTEDEDATDAMGVGTVLHSLVLEGHADCAAVIDPKDHPNEKGGGIPVGWTNKAMKAAKAAAIAAGKVPLLPESMRRVETMAAAARAYITTLERTQPALWRAFQPGGGESEVVIVWQERDGTLCKIRPDRISLDRAVMVSLKTTLASAEPEGWFRRQATAMGYPIASAFYRRGLEQALRVEAEEVWLVQEQDPPFLCSLVGLEPMGLHAAQMRMLRALRTWSACASSGCWPGYPNDVVEVESPPWELARAEEVPAHQIAQDPDLMGREFAIARETEEQRWARNLAEERSPAA